MNHAAAAALFLLLTVATAQAAPLSAAEGARWRADLRFMAAQMEARHRNLYHSVSKTDFSKAVASLDKRIPSLQRHQIIVEMMRIAASVGDGHTNISPTRDPAIAFHTLPVRMYFFDEGLFIRAASKENAGLAGARVLRIGGVSVEEAWRRVRDLVSRDNEMGAKQLAPMLLAMPEVLEALGMARSIDAASFTVDDGGGERTVELRSAGPFEPMPSDTDTSWEIPEGWVDARQTAGTPTALWLENPHQLFRLRFLPESSTLYAQINKVGDDPAETLLAFSSRLRDAMISSGAQRLALDLRLNRGGNGGLLPPLLKSILRTEMLEQKGRFFVLIGRSTFSAAQFLVDDLQTYADPVFVGEPTGSKPNAYGDSRKIVLPNSGITVRASVYYWQRNPWEDDVDWIVPELAAPLRFEEYRRNIDPSLEAAIHYQPEEPLRRIIAAAMLSGGRESALKALQAFDGDVRHRYIDREEELILAGYDPDVKSRPGLPLETFRFAVEQLPRSAAAHYHLAVALSEHHPAEAREEAIRTLTLSPGDSEAKELLRSLNTAAHP